MSKHTAYASVQEIHQSHLRLTKTFEEGRTLLLKYRREQLHQVARLVQENHTQIENAVKDDLGRHLLEVRLPELGPIINSALRAAENLEEWNAPEKPTVEEWRSGWDTTIYKTPKGTVLLISPWNFPWIVTFLPLIGAIAAGCTCVIKPSEHAPACAATMKKLVPKYLDHDAYTVCFGAVPETAELLKLKWDHIFYTGNLTVGKIVAEAAAKYVTPLTLELGSQSPVFVDAANLSQDELDIAAKRILSAKQYNSGQVCIAPNHIFVEERYQNALVEAFKKAYASFWPKGPLDKSSDMAHMINEGHYKRIQSLLRETKGKLEFGGQSKGLWIEPAFVTDVKMDDALLREEIFGPALPIVPVPNADTAIEHIRKGPTPLVIFVFTESEEIKDKFVQRTQSGQLVLNDTFSQLAVFEIPFGGQGESGYGSYIGKFSFDTFIHKRGFVNIPLDQGTEEFISGRYPPYSQDTLNFFSQALSREIPKD